MTHLYFVGAAVECSVESRIRAYVIVQGSCNFLQVIVATIVVYIRAKDDKKSILSICLSYLNLLFMIFLMLFLIIWTIFGSIWVWGSLSDWQDDHSACNSTLYISAAICVSLHYVVVPLFLCCYCTGVILAKFCEEKHKSAS